MNSMFLIIMFSICSTSLGGGVLKRHDDAMVRRESVAKVSVHLHHSGGFRDAAATSHKSRDGDVGSGSEKEKFPGAGEIMQVLGNGMTTMLGGDACPLPDNAKWCEVTLGEPFQMAVYDRDDIVSNAICKTGTWELGENDMAAFGPAGNALDIGANVGFYSLALANRGWNVIAFEPMATNNALMEATMCRNPALNAKITLNKIGLSATNDHCIIISGDTNVGDGNCKCGEAAANFTKLGQVGYHQRADFDVRRLDDVLVEQEVEQIDFVKMDVEGYEGQVMGGGQSLLTKFRPRLIQSEVWHNMVGVTPTDYLGSFAKASYTVASDRACTVANASRPVNIDNRYMCTKAEASLLENVVRRSPAVRSTVWLRRT